MMVSIALGMITGQSVFSPEKNPKKIKHTQPMVFNILIIRMFLKTNPPTIKTEAKYPIYSAK